MNAEELKMILEAINSLAGGGKEAFGWWLVAKYGASLVSWLMTLAAIGIVAFTVYKIVKLLKPPTKTAPLEDAYIAVRHLWLTRPDSDMTVYQMYTELGNRMQEEKRK